MKLGFQFVWYISSFFLIFSTMAWADIALCKIDIEDVKKGTTYTIEEKFIFTDPGKENYPVVGRKRFEVPGNNYTCTFVFFGFDSGTMISCEYKEDLAHTFFASDRSVLKDEILTNNLRFRHGSAFIDIKTKCE